MVTLSPRFLLSLSFNLIILFSWLGKAFWKFIVLESCYLNQSTSVQYRLVFFLESPAIFYCSIANVIQGIHKHIHIYRYMDVQNSISSSTFHWITHFFLQLHMPEIPVDLFFTSQTMAVKLSSIYNVPVAEVDFTDLGQGVKYPRRINGILQVVLYPKQGTVVNDKTDTKQQCYIL